MPVQKQLSPSFEISAKVSYVEAESRPENEYFFFGYQISITNHGASSAQLISRHWIICDGNGQIEEVRGAGVVGLQPRIHPGQTFKYESACPLPTSHGSMRGFYQMQSEDGETFEIEIPEFYLIAPTALH